MSNDTLQRCSCGRPIRFSKHEQLHAKKCPNCGCYVLPCILCEEDDDCFSNDKFCKYRQEILNGSYVDPADNPDEDRICKYRKKVSSEETN